MHPDTPPEVRARVRAYVAARMFVEAVNLAEDTATDLDCWSGMTAEEFRDYHLGRELMQRARTAAGRSPPGARDAA
jgi:hypothetical protein